MSGQSEKIDEIALSHIEVLIDENMRKDGVVKPLKQWPTAHLIHLMEMLKEEMVSREETRPFWV